MDRVAAAPDAPEPTTARSRNAPPSTRTSTSCATTRLWPPCWQRFAEQNAASLRLVETADLDAAVPVPRDAPWFPKDVDAWSVRWVILHLCNELARHAGHADIIRESIDGATMYELIAGAEGAEPQPWLTPWRPPSG